MLKFGPALANPYSGHYNNVYLIKKIKKMYNVFFLPIKSFYFTNFILTNS